MATPRHFLPDGQQDGSARQEAFPLAHVIDNFVIGGRHRVGREWIVGLDAIGHLAMRSPDDSSALMATARAEYAYCDVARGEPPRTIDVDQLYLMSVQLLEQPGEAPGLDDPVYLYGRLYGPYPSSAGGRAPAINGQLTTTRGDVLGGMSASRKYVLSYENASDSQTAAAFYHMALPGGRKTAIDAGRGIVLAYPMLPPSLAVDTVGNDLVVNRMLHDLLNALQDDMARQDHAGWLVEATVPVTNRAKVIRRLEDKGYKVEGNSAIRQTPQKEGFAGMLSSVFGGLTADRLTIPAQGTTAEFFELADRAAADIDGWPSARLKALGRRIQTVTQSEELPSSSLTNRPPPSRSSTPVSSVPATAPPTPNRIRPAHRPDHSQGPPKWMQDFIDSHHSSDAAPSSLTYSEDTVSDEADGDPESWRADFDDNQNPAHGSATASETSPADSDKSPDWMSDFGQSTPPAPEQSSPEGADAEPSDGGPDWMDDFQ